MATSPSSSPLSSLTAPHFPVKVTASHLGTFIVTVKFCCWWFRLRREAPTGTSLSSWYFARAQEVLLSFWSAPAATPAARSGPSPLFHPEDDTNTSSVFLLVFVWETKTHTQKQRGCCWHCVGKKQGKRFVNHPCVCMSVASNVTAIM